MNNPPIRLIFFDIDGTFVDDIHKQPAPDALAVMDELITRGVRFIPCTGRGFPGISCYPGLLERCCGAICYDGGLVFELAHPAPPRVIRRMSLHPDTYSDFLGIVLDDPHHKDALVVFVDDDMHLLGVPPEQASNLSVWGSRPVWSDYGALRKLNGPQIVIYYGQNERVDVLEQNLRQRHGNRFHPIRYESDAMNCTGLIIKHLDTHKGSALRWYAETLGVDHAETMGIGDWLNDLTLVRDAGVGVAMKNARPEVKALADRETPLDNNQWGAIEFLKEYWNL